MPTNYAVTIDTEEEWDWDAGWPVVSHSLRNLSTAPAFHALCKTHGARTTWFTNWSVMNQENGRATILDITANEDAELGMHIHPWITPPISPDDNTSARQSFLHNSPASVIHQKLDTVWRIFTEHGCKPRSFRGGRYSCGPEIQKFLQHPDRAFIADASVVPFTKWDDDGAPDYRDRDLQPNRLNPTQEGASAMWEIPCTLAYTRNNMEFWAEAFDRIEHSFLRHLRLSGILGTTGIVRRVWLNFEFTPADEMIALLTFLEKLNLPCITLTIHSSSLMKGGNSYSATQKDVDDIFQRTEQVLGWLAENKSFEPATIAEIAQGLERDYLTQQQPATTNTATTNTATTNTATRERA